MRRRNTLAVLVALPVVTCVLVLGASPAVGAHGAATASSEYTVLIEEGASRNAAVAAVSAAGGTVIRENASVGTLAVRAPAAGFVQRVSASPAIVGAARVRPIGRLSGVTPADVNAATAVAGHLRHAVETAAAVGLDPLDGGQWAAAT